ncbi:MAG TPA: protein kinase [Kofleriaceae bacterium]|nr:protein kinase [Kofleriaceae bacterium]
MTVAATERVGRYQLLDPIGVGPCGTVSRAKVFGVAGFERQFAIKRFHPEITATVSLAQALSAAARAYGSLEHPRIARMSEFGVAQGITFTAVEYVAGLDALRVIAEAKLAGSAIAAGGALALVSQAARAVGYAHGRGLTHLGLAPTNVMITAEGDIKITDFGLLAATLPPRPVETPRLASRVPYLAPEQLSGEATSAATDVFALGVLAYELVTGHRTFRGETPQQIAQSVMAGPPIEPPLPRPIVRVLQRCLARSPFERFPDARALADALDAALRVAPVPGTRKDIGAQVKQALERISALHEGDLSGVLPLHIGTGPIQRISEPAVTQDHSDELATHEIKPVQRESGLAAPAQAGGPDQPGRTAPDLPRAGAFSTVPGVPPAPVPVPQGVASPGAPSRRPSSVGSGTFVGIPQQRLPSASGGRPPATPPGATRPSSPGAPSGPPPVPSGPPPVPSAPAAGGRVGLPRLPTPLPSVLSSSQPPPASQPAPGSSPSQRISADLEIPVEPEDPAGMSAPAPGDDDDLEIATLARRSSPKATPASGDAGDDHDDPELDIATGMHERQRMARMAAADDGDLAEPVSDADAASWGEDGGDGEGGEDGDQPMRPRASSLPEEPAAFADGTNLAAEIPGGGFAEEPPRPNTNIPLEALGPSVIRLGREPAAPPDGPGAPRGGGHLLPPAAPGGAGQPPERLAGEPGPAGAPAASAAPAREAQRRRLLLAGGGVAAAAVLAVGGWFVYGAISSDGGAPGSGATGSGATGSSATGSGATGGGATGSGATGSSATGSSAVATGSGTRAPVDAPPAAVELRPDAAPKPPDGPKPSNELSIVSTPAGARVFIDGADAGTTPLKLPGTNDRHTVAILLPGHELYVAQVDGHGQFSIPLKEVTPSGDFAGIKVLRCKDKDRYYVFVDGKPTGQTCPTERINTTVGKHVVEVYDIVTEARRKWEINIKDGRLSYRIRIDP